MHTIQLTDPNGIEHLLSVKEFEEIFGIHYLKYNQVNACRYLQKQTHTYLKKSKEAKKALWLGKLYRDNLLSGYLAPLQIYWINDSIGFGAKATKELKKGEYIGSYAGKVKRRTLFTNNTNAYSFSYPSSPYVMVKYTIDAERDGNEIRFLNHSSQPNCEPSAIHVEGYLHIILRTLKTISTGEQLTYDYGEQYWKGYENNKNLLKEPLLFIR